MSILDVAEGAVETAASPWKLWLIGGALVVTVTSAGVWLHARDVANFNRGATEANAKVAARDVIQARAVVEQANKNAGITADRQEQKDAADTTREQHQQVAAVASAAGRTELDGLRNDLRAARTALDDAVSSSSCAPYRQAIATRDAVLDAMATEGAGVAAIAQGHADDSLMFQQAWPKQ